MTPIVAVVDDEEAALKALHSDIHDYLVKGRITDDLLKRSLRYVTQLKRARETQLQCEQTFASFMRNIPVAAWIKDLHGRYVYGNAEHERIFAMPLSEYAGKRDDEFLPPDTARQLRENDDRVLAEGESLQTIEALRQANGIDRHFIVNKFPIMNPDGRPAYVAGIGLDITERVRAEEALRKSERKFMKVFHEVPALIAISTLKEGRYIDINETALETLGYRRDEVIGRSALEINFWVDLSDRAESLQKLAEQGSVRNFEFRFRGKTGQSLVGLLSAEFIDIDGERCMLSLVRDITDRKQAEEALQKSERKFAKIFHAVPALVGISTLEEGRFVDVNDTMLQILGYRRDEMIGRTALELNLWVDVSDRARCCRRWKKRDRQKISRSGSGERAARACRPLFRGIHRS